MGERRSPSAVLVSLIAYRPLCWALLCLRKLASFQD